MICECIVNYNPVFWMWLSMWTGVYLGHLMTKDKIVNNYTHIENNYIYDEDEDEDKDDNDNKDNDNKDEEDNNDEIVRDINLTL